jgi:hypothetical protein
MVVVLVTPDATASNRLCEVERGAAIRDQIESGRFGWRALLTLGNHSALMNRLRR